MLFTDEEFAMVTLGLALLANKPKLFDPVETMDLYKRLHIERVEASKPALWLSSTFTDAERSIFLEYKEEEIRDCVKDMAESQLDQADMPELIGYLVDDVTEMTVCLMAIRDGNADLSDYMSGEHESHKAVAGWINRFNMLKPDGSLTQLAHDFIGQFPE